jgi:hypothetical protein
MIKIPKGELLEWGVCKVGEEDSQGRWVAEDNLVVLTEEEYNRMVGSPVDGMTFGQAIDACRYKGEKIQRAEWNSADYVCFDKDTDCFVMDKDGVLLEWGTTQYDMAANDWMIVE